jgi:hypothetical protein
MWPRIPTKQVLLWRWYYIMSRADRYAYEPGIASCHTQRAQFFETRTSLQTTVSSFGTHPFQHWSTKGSLYLEEKKHEGNKDWKKNLKRNEHDPKKPFVKTQNTSYVCVCVCVCVFMRDILYNYLPVTLGTLLNQIPSQSNNSQKQTKFLVLITFSNNF